MKSIFTFLLVTFLGVTAFARREDGRLTISAVGNQALSITVDGNRYTYNGNQLRIHQLSPGHHQIKVYQPSKKGWGFNRDRLIYSTSVYVKPMYHVDILINRFGKALLDERNMNSREYFEDERNWYDAGNGQPDNDDNRWNNNGGFNRPMTSETFERLKQSVRNEPFDNSRLLITRQALDINFISSDQVKQLAQLFSFDGNRLDFAKFAYDRTTDKEDFFVVYDVFTMSSNKNELAAYVRNRR